MIKYGLQWADETDPIAIELALYSRDDIRERAAGHCLSKWEHMRNAIKMLVPENVFAWHRWVDKLGEEWCRGGCLTVWGAGSTTKSGILGMLAYVDLLCAPKDTLTVMVTNPLEKHWDRCFSKMLQWRGAMPDRYKIGKITKHPKPQLLTVEGQDGSRMGVVCISNDQGESSADMAKKVGAHAKRVRLIVDEAQGCTDAVMGLKMNLGASGDYQEVFIGNPTSWQNPLGLHAMPLDGDKKRIHDEEPDEWDTASLWDDQPGRCIVFDGKRCPTLDSPEEAKRLGFMLSPRMLKQAQSMPGGENSIYYWSQVRGRIPPAGMCVTVLSELDLDASGCKVQVPFQGQTHDYVGGDLSLGGDKVPMYRIRVGSVAGLGVVACIVARHYLTVDITKPDATGQMSKQFGPLLKRWQIHRLEDVALEASGQQGAIVDTFERDVNGATGNGRIYRVKSEHAVSERRLSYGKKDTRGKREMAKERYKDRASELVMNIVECVYQRCLFGIDNEVAAQVTTRGIDEGSLEGGLLKVQTKKKWRESNGDQSPDEMDAVAVGITMLLEKGILKPGRDTQVEPVREGLEEWMLPKPPTPSKGLGNRKVVVTVRKWGRN
ncbi:hypothetical protein SAMN02745166_01068 [Prosthecobacter debontii]|uniref:Terminase-like family protein n=1 Tax=Prosthecobacter debontii TaxID=48467 RepID=A0A1T4X5Y7_9BACT|nr:hypothetical protein [Prosthecobacter debontii]SKA84839.1 hypothetical protein SAMN02745166_01068 [Prosthecobacter debontii]